MSVQTKMSVKWLNKRESRRTIPHVSPITPLDYGQTIPASYFWLELPSPSPKRRLYACKRIPIASTPCNNQCPMSHDVLTIGEFMSGLKKRDYETCRNTSDDLIRDVHTTCKSHPNEWYDAKFALINLQVELKHYLRELPEENADLRSLISKIIDIVAGAMETLTHLIKTITPHLPADMVISAYVPSKKTSNLNLTVKRIHLVEKIYGEYVMKVYNNGKATLPEIVNHYNETFGLKLTIDEIYDGYARIKSRGGKKDWIHDKENNIYDLAYWTRATAEAINNHIINNSSLKGGRPPTPGNVESKDLDFD